MRVQENNYLNPFDEDLAADTFEEMEDDVKGSIIKDLSETKLRTS